MQPPVKIPLQKFRGHKSTLFTGRPQGESARKELKLDQKDTSNKMYTFIVPKGTTSINPSFFLGLLFKSIKKLSPNGFKKKYTFEFEEKENPEIVEILKQNIADAMRNAKNTLRDDDTFLLL